MAAFFKILSVVILWLCAFLLTENPWVPYEVTLGRYGADCTGRGTCGFVEPPGTYNSRLSYSKEDSVLKMQLLNNKFSNDALQRQFEKEMIDGRIAPGDVFVMEDDCPLPAALKARLQIPAGLNKIPRGSYRADASDEYILVHFKIK